MDSSWSSCIPPAVLLVSYVALARHLLHHPEDVPEFFKRRKFWRHENPPHGLSVVAHRGGGGEAPENSIAAFRRAASGQPEPRQDEEGAAITPTTPCRRRPLADCVELDVQFTKDRVPVVLHDKDLQRVAGLDRSLPVGQVEFKDLPNLAATLPGSVAGSEEAVPSLEEALVLLASSDPAVLVNIDVKGAGVDGMKRVSELVTALKLEDRVVWGSADNSTCSDVLYGLNPRVRLFFNTFEVVFYVFGMFWLGLLPFVTVRPCFLELPITLQSYVGERLAKLLDPVILHRPLVFKHLAKRGISTWFWVLNDTKEFDKALDLGATGIITDYPTLLRRHLAHRRPTVAPYSIH